MGVFYLEPHFLIFLDICYILYKTLSTLRGEAILFAYVCLCARWFQWWPTLHEPVTVACQAPLSMGFSKQEYWS